MIEHPAFTVEEWSVREMGLHLDTLAQTESIFALANGHIGLRGNLDEGEPYGLPGTYLNSFYELRPLPYAEGGYAYPESGQTAINVINGKLIRLLVDDEPFDVRCAAGCCAAASGGPPLRAAQSRSHPCAWCRSPSGPSRRSATRSSRLTPRCVWLYSRNWSPTRRCQTRAKTPGWAPRSPPHLRARSTRLRRPAGSWSITPGSVACASGRRWTTRLRDLPAWSSPPKAPPMSPASPSPGG